MSRLVVIALTLICIGAAEASGQADGVDVYFDQAATAQCVVAGPGSFMSAYVIYSTPSVTEISGFDIGVAIAQYFSGPPQILEILTPCAASITEIDQMSVRCATPIVCTAQTTLCEVRLLFLGGVSRLTVTGAAAPSLPVAGPFVVLGNGTSVALNAGGAGATIDGGFDHCEGLPIEQTTWGTMKSLYRQ